MSAIYDTLKGSSATLKNQGSLSDLANEVFKILQSRGKLPKIGRVVNIKLHDNPQTKFVEQGAIEFEEVGGGSLGLGLNTARPLDPNIRKYPVKDELVYIIGMPGQGLQTNSNSITYYYISNIGMWNNPNYNGFPKDPERQDPNLNKNIQTITAGLPSKATATPITTQQTGTFREKGNIHPLSYYEGDVNIEGRWGNSIRLGSTIKQGARIIFPPKQLTGSLGDPLVMIRNGQNPNNTENFSTVDENFEQDLASIYLTSTQQIPLNIGTGLLQTYNSGSAPEPPAIYAKPQIALNSGRILLNAGTVEGSILLFGSKTIGLQSNKTINIKAESDIILEGSTVKITSNATSPAAKGDELVSLLTILIQQLNEFMIVCKDITYEKYNPNTGKSEAERIEGITTMASSISSKLFPKLIAQLPNIVSNKLLLPK